MTNALPRKSGRSIVIGLLSLIAVTVVTAVFLWLRGHEPRGPILAMTPVDDHRVLLVRRGYRQNEYVNLTLRDMRRGQLWSVALFAVQPGASPVVFEGVVALRVRDARGRPETHAFHLDTGQFAWRAGALPLGPFDRARGADALDRGTLFEVYGGREARVLAIEMRTGRVRWETRVQGGDGNVRLVAQDDAVAADAGRGSYQRFDRDRGEAIEGTDVRARDPWTVRFEGAKLEIGSREGAHTPAMRTWTSTVAPHARLYADGVVLFGGDRIVVYDAPHDRWLGLEARPADESPIVDVRVDGRLLWIAAGRAVASVRLDDGTIVDRHGDLEIRNVGAVVDAWIPASRP